MGDTIPYEDWLNDLANLLDHDRKFEPPEMTVKEATALGRRLLKLQEKHPLTQALFEYAIDGKRLPLEETHHLSACGECKDFVAMCRRWQQYVKNRRTDRVA